MTPPELSRDGGVYLGLKTAWRQWELPSWVEHYRLTPADWPEFRAAVRDALQDGHGRSPSWGHRPPSCLLAPQARLRRGRGALVEPLTWQGDMSFGLRGDRQHTFQRLDGNPRWKVIPDLRLALDS